MAQVIFHPDPPMLDWVKVFDIRQTVKDSLKDWWSERINGSLMQALEGDEHGQGK